MRIVLQQPNPLDEWDDLVYGVSSTLLEVEAYRTLDQLWHRNQFRESALAEKQTILRTFLPRLDLQPLSPAVLSFASQPLPVPLRTLDAIHLATAMIYRAGQPDDERPIVFATHDVALARAATAMHFDVIGTLA